MHPIVSLFRRLAHWPFAALGLFLAAGTAAAQTTPVGSVTLSQADALQRAEGLLRDGKREDAEEVLSRHLAIQPHDGRAWLMLGRIYLADAQRWHREAHTGPTPGPTLLAFAGQSFEAAQQVLTDSADVYRVLVAVERATTRIESDGWPADGTWGMAPVDVPLPPVLAELGRNLLASCGRNGVLVTGSMVETAAVWGIRLVSAERSDVVMLRPDMFQWDARYRHQMAPAIGADTDATLPAALVAAGGKRPICLTPAVDSLTAPALEWRPVRMVLAAGPSQPSPDTLTVFQFSRTGLAGSVWSAAVRDVYDMAARRNQSLCTTLFANDELLRLPELSACPR
jgi:Tetratricopeptide repeat